MTGSNVFNKNYGFIITVLGLTALLFVMINDSVSEPELKTKVQDPTTVEVSDDNSFPAETTLQPHYAVAPDLETSGNELELYRGIKDVLDNLILSADSTDKDTILALANSWCQSQDLNDSGCKDFTALLSRYIDYKIAMASHETMEGRSSDLMQQMRDRLSQLQALRYQWFSEEEVMALFDEDQQTDELALQRREIAMATDLTREQKLELIAQHYDQLPEEQRAPLEPTLQMYELDSIKNQYEDKQLRLLEVETKFGYEAAQRLEKTWQKQEVFQDKLEQVASEYQSLEGNNDTTLKEQQLLFLAKHFSGNEVRRARAILKTYSLPSNS